MSKAHAAVLQMTGGVNLIYESMEMDAGMNSKKQKAVTVDNQMMRSQCAQNCTMMLSMQQITNIPFHHLTFSRQHHVRNVRTVVCLFCCIFFSIPQECNVSKDHLKNCAMSAASPFLWNINNHVVCFERTMTIDGVDCGQFCHHHCPVATLC